jgi:hypothetical protein
MERQIYFYTDEAYLIITMQDKQQEQVRELTAEEKQRLEQIEITRRKSEKYLSLGDGEELTLRFNISKIEYKEVEGFMGKGKVWKYVFQVVVPDWDQFDEKEFKLSRSHGNDLHKILQKGYTLIRVKRIGSHTETRYEFTPLS